MTTHIAADTYTGRHMIRSNKKRSGVFTAQELAAMASEARPFWEFSGHVQGVALYVRTRFVGQPDGSLRGYDSTGRLVIIHPTDRKIRVITK